LLWECLGWDAAAEESIGREQRKMEAVTKSPQEEEFIWKGKIQVNTDLKFNKKMEVYDGYFKK